MAAALVTAALVTAETAVNLAASAVSLAPADLALTTAGVADFPLPALKAAVAILPSLLTAARAGKGVPGVTVKALSLGVPALARGL